MSEFLAEATVRIVPDTTKFRTELQAQLKAATSSLKPIAVPVIPVAAGPAAQQAAGAMRTFNETTKQSTQALLGAASASAKLDAGLLGLRTALGSTAVIGLGAFSLAAILAGKAVRSMIIGTAALEQELNTFQATTGATADEMQRVSEAATRLGADIRLPAVSASDAAVAMTELARAGLSVEESIAGAEGVLQLATAAQISNADAAQIAANALNSFGLEGAQAVEVADALANAANAAQGSITDVGIAMRQASAVAKQVGLSFQDTTSILALFAKNGLQGSDAGTSLRVALIRLVAPTKEAAAEIRKLGLQIRDAQGNIRADVFAQFGEATRDLAPAARDAAAALIFGQDAIRAAAIGAREGAEGLRLMQFEIDRQGTAAEVSAARTKGLAGSFEALNSSLSTLGTSLGKAITGPLGTFLKGLSDLATLGTLGVDKLQQLSDLLDRIPGNKQTNDFLTDFVEQGLVPLPVQAFKAAQSLGLFKDESEETQKKVRGLKEELQALQDARITAAEAGNFFAADALTPQIEKLKKEISDLNKEITGVDPTPLGRIRDAIAELGKLPPGTPGVKAAIDSLIAQMAALKAGGTGAMAPLTTGLNETSTAADKASAALARTTAQVKELSRESVILGDKLLKLQTEGGTPAQQIGVLQQDIQTQRDIITAAQAHGNQPGDATTIRKAREQIKADQAEIDSLQAGIEADQKKAVDKAKDAAKKAAQLAEEQTKAFIEAFGGGRARRIQQAELAAGLTEDARDDLAADKRLKRFLIDKRKAIRERIKELKLHGDALKAARDAIKKLNDEIDRINNEIAQDQQRVGQQQVESVQLDIDLANTQGNTKKEIAARKRLIKILQQQLALTKKGTLEYKRLRNAIAEQNEAIEELNKEKKKQGKTLAQSQFEFLQSLQGFSANLLGNLIPGFATGGLVGNTSASATSDIDTLRGSTQARVSQADAVRGAQDRGVRPIQVDTTNQLLRAILRTLQGEKGRMPHPEAKYQRSVGASFFDTL